MSFLTAIPQELLSAAAQLEGIGSALTAQNAGAAAPTTAIAPAGADPVSLMQAGIFSAYGTLYQELAAEAQAMQQQFTSTLGLSSSTYTETEAANAASAAAAPTSFLGGLAALLGGPLTSLNNTPFSLSGNLANIFNIGGGNFASAGSNLLGLTGGGLLPAADTAAADAGAAAAADTAPAAGGAAGMGVMPVAGMGAATTVGNKLSVPPSWAGAGAPTAAAARPITVGWTGAAPQAGTGGIIPGMPGMVGGGRNSAGFGAPRYGVKPLVMPKMKAV